MKEYNGKELIIMACSKCNNSCSHCYISYKGDRKPDELYEIVKKLKSKYQININGAEILTDTGYLKSYKEINQHFVLTNGKVFLTNPNIIEELKKNNINSVSISYHFGIQDDISMIKESELYEIIKIIKSNSLNFRILTTITAKNYMLIPYMCDKAHDIGARGIKFTNFLKQGNAQSMSEDNILNMQQIKKVFELIEEERNNYDVSDFIIERCGTFGKNEFSSHDHFFCDCITDSIVLTPDNNIYPCVFLAKHGYEIGTYDGEKIFLQEEIINKHDECFAKEICNESKILIKRRLKNEKN